MRYLILLSSALILSGCVSSGKYKKYIAVSESLFAQQADSIRLLQDSTLTMRLAVERAAGSNDALLASQDKYMARLQEQEDQLDQLRGNLTSTNFQMTNQLAELRKDLALSEASYDTLLSDQAKLISTFQEGVKDAGNLLDTMLRQNVDTLAYDIIIGAGIVTLSVQEELLFEPRATDKTNDEASFVLRAVTEAMQDDPLLKLIIVGHTDNQPNPRRNTDNWVYAGLRAAFLADELTQTYYLSPNRITAASHGEFGPRTSNSTEDGRKMNRRVDFVLQNNVGNLLRELDKLKGEREEEKE